MGELSQRQTRVTRLNEVLDSLDGALRAGDTTDLAVTPTGFKALDEVVGGGLHPGDLTVLAGPPGIGKTIASLQIARNVAHGGGHAVYVCYEHEEAVLTARLLALEAAHGGSDGAGRAVAASLLDGARARQGLAETIAQEPLLGPALERLQSYADRILLVRASGAHTAIPDIDAVIEQATADAPRPVVFIDYLQKVPIHPEPPTEAEKVTLTVEALKDLALAHHVPIVAVSAVDRAGMDARRLRLHHLRGSSAIAFESDVVVMLNDKHRAVAKVHLAYDPIGAKRFRDWVVFSVEKNRGGPTLVDLEFRKDFANFRFDPEGQMVTEKLVDERLDDELT